MTLPQVKTAPRGLRAVAPVGLAIALMLGAIGAGYVAGKAQAPGAPDIALDQAMTHASEAQMEGLLLLLLGRGGVL